MVLSLRERQEHNKLSQKKYRNKTVIALKPQKPDIISDEANAKTAKARSYYQLHKEHLVEYHQAYCQSDKGRKSYRISAWKQRGVKCDDYNALYDRYIATTNCEICDCVLTTGTKKDCRCLDHNHISGEVRNILCKSCNLVRR